MFARSKRFCAVWVFVLLEYLRSAVKRGEVESAVCDRRRSPKKVAQACYR
jgi:hypothetical protein